LKEHLKTISLTLKLSSIHASGNQPVTQTSLLLTTAIKSMLEHVKYQAINLHAKQVFLD